MNNIPLQNPGKEATDRNTGHRYYLSCRWKKVSTDIFLPHSRKEICMNGTDIGPYLLRHATELRLLIGVLSIVVGFAAIKFAVILGMGAKSLSNAVRPFLNVNSRSLQTTNQPGTVGAR
jgi:hypothetical protein